MAYYGSSAHTRLGQSCLKVSLKCVGLAGFDDSCDIQIYNHIADRSSFAVNSWSGDQTVL